MNRYRFIDVFRENPDGTLTPLRPIHVNGVVFGPGVSIGPGVAFGGVNFLQYKHLDIAGQEKDGLLIVKGFFKPTV